MQRRGQLVRAALAGAIATAIVPAATARADAGAVSVSVAAAATARGAKFARGRRTGVDADSCLRVLTELGVRYRRVRRPGIRIGVEVESDLGGVRYQAYDRRPLVLDCSLVVSLAEAGRYLTAQGFDRAVYSSSYERRFIHGTHHWSKHAFGLAIDVHALLGPTVGKLTVRDDWEQGLGRDGDCVGHPLTRAGAVLRTIYCECRRSRLFHLILSPDYDAWHYNHWHMEAAPWSERDDRALVVRRAALLAHARASARRSARR